MSTKKIYSWLAVDLESNQYQGETQGISVNDVRRLLISQGLIPLRVKMSARFSFNRGVAKTRYILTHELAVMLHAGVPLLTCLQLLAQGQEQAQWRYLLGQIQQEIAKGLPFSQALSQYPDVFPPLFCEVIRMGELTGELELCCNKLAEQQEKADRIQKSISKALRYPLFILVMTVLVTLLMLVFVLPEFTEIYASFDAELPKFTLLFIQISDGLRHYGWISSTVVASLFVLYCKYRRLNPTCIKKEQSILLKLPLISQLIRITCLTRLFSTLSLTQRTGIPLIDGLNAAINSMQYERYQQVLLAVKRRIEEGFSFYQAIAKEEFFTALSKQLIQVGEESGAIDSMFEKLTAIYEQQTETQTEKFTQMLEPMLMTFLAVIVGSLIIAMYLPIFQLGNVMH